MLALALAAGLTLATGPDSIHSSAGEVDDGSHAVDLVIDRGYVRLRVTRRLVNIGGETGNADVHVRIPRHSVATGLRTRDDAGWHRAKLMPEKIADAAYRNYRGSSRHQQPPALLSWEAQELMQLQVAPIAAGSSRTVEYTLAAPTTYAKGTYQFTLPRMGTERHAATVRVRAAHRGDQLLIDHKPVPAGAALHWDPDRSAVTVGLRRAKPPTLDGALAAIPLGGDRTLVHGRIDIAPELAAIPKRAQVVVILDDSRSLPDDVAAAQRIAAAGYLAHLPDAKVEILTFDREVRARHGRFVPVATAIADLETLPLRRRNGSAVGEALHVADAKLARQPAGRPRRIVLITDLHTRSSLSPERVAAEHRRSGALLHIATPRLGKPSLQRVDDDGWPMVAQATGGLQWAMAIDAEDPAASGLAVEALAHPIQIDHARVQIQGLEPDVDDEVLERGSGVDVTWVADVAAPAGGGWLKLEGEVWSRPIHQTWVPSRAEGDRWSGLVFGSNEFSALEEGDMLGLATRGQVVSPATSFVTLKPGQRPQSRSGGGYGYGSAHCGGIGRIGARTAKRRTVADREAILTAKLSEAVALCGGAGKIVHAKLETTVREVVDVTGVWLDEGSDPTLVRCVQAEIWDFDLPAGFDRVFQSFQIDATA